MVKQNIQYTAFIWGHRLLPSGERHRPLFLPPSAPPGYKGTALSKRHHKTNDEAGHSPWHCAVSALLVWRSWAAPEAQGCWSYGNHGWVRHWRQLRSCWQSSFELQATTPCPSVPPPSVNQVVTQTLAPSYPAPKSNFRSETVQKASFRKYHLFEKKKIKIKTSNSGKFPKSNYTRESKYPEKQPQLLPAWQCCPQAVQSSLLLSSLQWTLCSFESLPEPTVPLNTLVLGPSESPRGRPLLMPQYMFPLHAEKGTHYFLSSLWIWPQAYSKEASKISNQPSQLPGLVLPAQVLSLGAHTEIFDSHHIRLRDAGGPNSLMVL